MMKKNNKSALLNILYEFSIDYGLIDKKKILNTRKFLMKGNLMQANLYIHQLGIFSKTMVCFAFLR